MKQQTELFENSISVAAENAENDLGSLALSTAAAGVAIKGSLLTAGLVATGVGAPLAVLAGATTALVSGGLALAAIASEVGDQEENNKARAVAVQYGAEQVSQNQGLLDSLEMQYDQQIATLNAEKQKLETEKLSAKGKTEIAAIDAKIAAKNQEIVDKEQQKVDGINKQKAANAQVFEQLIAQSQVMGGAFNDAIGLSIDEKFKEASGALKASVELAKSELSGMTDSTFKATLQVGLASGEIDPSVITSLIAANEESGGEIETTFNTLVTTQGTAEANQVMQLLLTAGVDTENIDVMLNYFSNSENFTEDVAALTQISSMKSAYGLSVNLDFNGEEKIAEVSSFMAETEKMPDVVTKDVITKYMEDYPNMSASTRETLQDMLANWDELAGKDNKANYQVLVDFATGKVDPNAILGLYLANQGMSTAPNNMHLMDLQKSRVTTADALAWFFGQADDVNDPNNDPGGDDPADTKTKKADPLEDMLKRLRAVRNATTNVSGGFEELNRVLRKGLGIEIFKGTNQKLMQAGYDKEFIDWLDGLDEATRKRFVTVKNGVVKVTEEGKRAQQALREIRIGDFQESLVQETQELNNQAKAYDRLTDGIDGLALSSEAAWELVQNGALASAIAIAATDEEVATLINRIKKNDDLEIKVKLKTPEGLKSLADEQMGAIAEVFAAREAEVNRLFAENTRYLTSANGLIAKAQDEILVSQDLIDDLQYDLDGIAKKEDEVNKKYDKRE
jgi:hypothetical protein